MLTAQALKYTLAIKHIIRCCQACCYAVQVWLTFDLLDNVVPLAAKCHEEERVTKRPRLHGFLTPEGVGVAPMEIVITGQELVNTVAKTDVVSWALQDMDTRTTLQEAVRFTGEFTITQSTVEAVTESDVVDPADAPAPNGADPAAAAADPAAPAVAE